MVILQKLILKKWLFTTFYVTTSCFSSIQFVIIPSTAKLVNCFASVLFITCFATQQVDETFAVTAKIMIDFICRFSDQTRKSISYLYTCTYLTPQVTTPTTMDIVFWEFWLLYQIFFSPQVPNLPPKIKILSILAKNCWKIEIKSFP